MSHSTTKLAIVAGILASTFTLAAHADYVQDPQLTEDRANKGESTVWVSHEDSDGGKGDVGSSGDTAFDDGGSSRFRFKEAAPNDYTATPGLSQVVTGLPADTEMEYSLYYCDKKGTTSASTLHYGVREVVDGQPLAGAIIADTRAHVKDLDGAATGAVKDCFKQVTVDFNSGSAGSVEIFALMEIDQDNGADMSKDAEVRVDEFSITAK